MADRQSYDLLVEHALSEISELAPWDLEEALGDLTEDDLRPLLIDVREPYEFALGFIDGSLNVPRGILEAACDYGFAETVVELVEARPRPVVVICRSGRRSALAAQTLRALGYRDVKSLKLGVKGWNDSDYPLSDVLGSVVDGEVAEEHLTPEITPEQLGPTIKGTG